MNQKEKKDDFTIVRSLSKVLIGSWEINGTSIPDSLLLSTGFGIIDKTSYLVLLKRKMGIYGISPDISSEITKIESFSPKVPNLTFFFYSIFRPSLSYLPDTKDFLKISSALSSTNIVPPKSSSFSLFDKELKKRFSYKKEELVFALQNTDLFFPTLESFPFISVKDSSLYIYIEDGIIYFDSFDLEIKNRIKSIKTNNELELVVFQNMPNSLLSLLEDVSKNLFISNKYNEQEAKISSVLSFTKNKKIESGELVLVYKKESVDSKKLPVKIALTKKAFLSTLNGKITTPDDVIMNIVDEKNGVLDKCQFRLSSAKKFVPCISTLNNSEEFSFSLSDESLEVIIDFLIKEKKTLEKKRKGYKRVSGLSIKTLPKIIPSI